MFQHITILPNQVLVDGHDLLTLKDSASFLSFLEKPSRVREIRMHPHGTRVAMVWDDYGLVAYADEPEAQMSHFILAFSTEDTPEKPTKPSKALIEINGAVITAETTAKTLPKKGPNPIIIDSARHYFYTSDLFSVFFGFERKSNSRGRFPRVGGMHYFSFSWKTK